MIIDADELLKFIENSHSRLCGHPGAYYSAIKNYINANKVEEPKPKFKIGDQVQKKGGLLVYEITSCPYLLKFENSYTYCQAEEIELVEKVSIKYSEIEEEHKRALAKSWKFIEETLTLDPFSQKELPQWTSVDLHCGVVVKIAGFEGLFLIKSKDSKTGLILLEPITWKPKYKVGDFVIWTKPSEYIEADDSFKIHKIDYAEKAYEAFLVDDKVNYPSRYIFPEEGLELALKENDYDEGDLYRMRGEAWSMALSKSHLGHCNVVHRYKIICKSLGISPGGEHE